jgi:hypothetical protein
VTREHDAILEGVYEARTHARRRTRARAAAAADSAVLLSRFSFSRRGAQRQLERKPEAHTELRLATQLELDVLAVRVRRAARAGAGVGAPQQARFASRSCAHKRCTAQAWFRARRMKDKRRRRAHTTAGVSCVLLSIAIRACPLLPMHSVPAHADAGTDNSHALLTFRHRRRSYPGVLCGHGARSQSGAQARLRQPGLLRSSAHDCVNGTRTHTHM